MMFYKQLTRSIVFLLLLRFSAPGFGEPITVPAAPELPAKAYFLMDSNSGKVLAEHNADDKLAPASLTKIMTVYVAFHELKNGNLALGDQVTVSKKAWQTGGSRMFIQVDTKVSVEQLLKGIIISSGNDASVALAEHIAGDESTFAQLMNQHAARLGMANTHFTNSMGLPDENHYASARDLATLTRALIREFPDYYAWHSIKEFNYNKITQVNRNKLLWRDSSVDGVKTGYTEDAGYCLVASAKKEDMRLISVVLGSQSTNTRASQNQALLNYGFRFYATHQLYKPNESLAEARIWKGEKTMLQLGLLDGLYVTIPRRRFDDLQATVQVDEKIMAPVSVGDKHGTLSITLADQPFTSVPLTALETIPEGGIFRKIYDGALLLLK
ncbi:MAG: D-alanyl-D-alanine carboxypeptidase [Methylococcaceae bacterium]|nr:D-alanyl-D-alanine carboxypeptidase [Methylococcaceae bacterium]MCI0732235.1 D-alanyl-D-alanine carboxypeptidase [Methylococcaceae bacterium]